MLLSVFIVYLYSVSISVLVSVRIFALLRVCLAIADGYFFYLAITCQCIML